MSGEEQSDGAGYIQEKTKMYPLHRELYDAAKDWEYGSEHTHSDIEKIIGIPRLIEGKYSNEDYYNAISCANEMLTDIGKRLENIHGCGYLVIPPDKYPYYLQEVYAKSREIMRYGISISERAPREHMTTPAREFLDRQQVTYSRLYAINASKAKQLYSSENKRISERVSERVSEKGD